MIDTYTLFSRIQKLPKGLVSRFAPSPTGYLHVGHVLSAIFTFGISELNQGRCLIRIEDHDQSRSRSQYIEAILSDLTWLGFANEASQVSIQSQHPERYEDFFNKLNAKGLTYNCQCTRKEIEKTMGWREPGQELIYSGHCRDLSIPNGKDKGTRVKLPSEKVEFDDLFHGHLMQAPMEQCGDVLVRDRQGQWTYQFAVVVDDIVEGINLTIRGDDLLESTGRQILLKKMLLGYLPEMNYLHHPLIYDTGGKKLSKRLLSTGIHELRKQGWSPGKVIGEACFLGGLVKESTPISASQVKDLFHV